MLAEAGFDPNLVLLAPEADGEKIASTLALRPEVKIVDFTGSTAYGDWLKHNAHQASVYTEKAGVNTIVVDSTDDFAGMCRNIAFSLTLYSGQMCTTPQNILVPRDGIETESGHVSFDEVAAGIAGAVAKLIGDDARAVELTGAIVNDAVVSRIDAARSHGTVLLDSREVKHPTYPDAVVRTPLLLTQDAANEGMFDSEWFGPISFVVATDSTAQSLEIFRRIVGAKGALTAAVYSTDPRRAGRDGGRDARRRRAPVVQPDRRRVRQPVGRVLRLPRERRERGGERVAHRRRLRRPTGSGSSSPAGTSERRAGHRARWRPVRPGVPCVCSRRCGMVGCGTVSPNGTETQFLVRPDRAPVGRDDLEFEPRPTALARPGGDRVDQRAERAVAPVRRIHVDRRPASCVSGLAGSAYAPTCPTRQRPQLRHVLGVLAAGRGPDAPADVLVVLVLGDFGERRDEGERRVGQHFDPQATDGAGVLVVTRRIVTPSTCAHLSPVVSAVRWRAAFVDLRR